MRTEDRKYGWGVVGPGRFAREFVEELSGNPRVSLAAVASRNGERASRFAKDFGFEKTYDSYESLVKDPSVDVVYIAVPHVFHSEAARLAVSNGKAVFCEKPLTPSLEESVELTTLAANKGVFLMEGMKTGFLPAVTKAKEWIDDGAIGDVKTAYADFCFTGPQDPSDRLLNPELGGGAVLDVGIYPIHLTRLLLGEIETLKATGQLASTGVEETAVMVAAHESGARSCLSCSINSEIAMDAKILGTKGEIRLPKFHAATVVELWRGGKPVERVEDESGGMVTAEINAAHEALDCGLLECPGHSHADTLAIARLMDSAIRQVRGEG